MGNVYVVYSSSSKQALGDTIFTECVTVLAVQRLVGISRYLPITDRVADNWYWPSADFRSELTANFGLKIKAAAD